MSPLDCMLSDEVRAAVDDGRPIVALESTIIAHGLPKPDNLELARELEESVRDAGAVPATIAVKDGAFAIGMSDGELEWLASRGPKLPKASVNDLAVHAADGTSAALTVSATAWVAARNGIRVFATGGIGGVHRGGTGDVSRDLTLLAETQICVVSAGAKAVLDLPRTVEMLETLGVLVIGYGTNEFPSFYSRSSGIELEHRVDDPQRLARVAGTRWELGHRGILVANPIPADAEIDVSADIEAVLASAEEHGVTGKALTPYLLASLATRTKGRAVAANRALALNNARVAAALAVALSKRDGRALQ